MQHHRRRPLLGGWTCQHPHSAGGPGRCAGPAGAFPASGRIPEKARRLADPGLRGLAGLLRLAGRPGGKPHGRAADGHQGLHVAVPGACAGGHGPVAAAPAGAFELGPGGCADPGGPDPGGERRRGADGRPCPSVPVAERAHRRHRGCGVGAAGPCVLQKQPLYDRGLCGGPVPSGPGPQAPLALCAGGGPAVQRPAVELYPLPVRSFGADGPGQHHRGAGAVPGGPQADAGVSAGCRGVLRRAGHGAGICPGGQLSELCRVPHHRQGGSHLLGLPAAVPASGRGPRRFPRRRRDGQPALLYRGHREV